LAETTAGTGVTVNSVLAGPTRSEGVEEFIADLAQNQTRDSCRSGKGILYHWSTRFTAATFRDSG